MNQPSAPNSLIEGFPPLPKRRMAYDENGNAYELDFTSNDMHAYVLADRAQHTAGSESPAVVGSVANDPQFGALLTIYAHATLSGENDEAFKRLVAHTNALITPAAPVQQAQASLAILICPECNGARGHEKEFSTTTGGWVPCFACCTPQAFTNTPEGK